MAIAAPTRGCNGVITASTTSGGTFAAVGRLTGYSFTEESSPIDSSIMGSCAVSEEAGPVKTSVRIDSQWDGDDAVQALFVVGNKIHLKVYPEGTGSTANFYKTPSGGMTVLGRSIEANVNGLVTMSFNGTVNNATMTTTAVP